MSKVDMNFSAKCRQCPVRGIEQIVRGEIIRRSDPFSFEYTPESFCDIQIWTVWWQEKEEEATFFPYRPEFGDKFAPVYPGVVKDQKRIFGYPHGQAVEIIRHFIRRDAFICGKAFIVVVPVNHPEDVEPVSPLGRDADILTTELPAIRHVSLRADMALISVIKVYESVFCLYFEFLQLCI